MHEGPRRAESTLNIKKNSSKGSKASRNALGSSTFIKLDKASEGAKTASQTGLDLEDPFYSKKMGPFKEELEQALQKKGQAEQEDIANITPSI